MQLLAHGCQHHRPQVSPLPFLADDAVTVVGNRVIDDEPVEAADDNLTRNGLVQQCCRISISKVCVRARLKPCYSCWMKARDSEVTHRCRLFLTRHWASTSPTVSTSAHLESVMCAAGLIHGAAVGSTVFRDHMVMIAFYIVSIHTAHSSSHRHPSPIMREAHAYIATVVEFVVALLVLPSDGEAEKGCRYRRPQFSIVAARVPLFYSSIRHYPSKLLAMCEVLLFRVRGERNSQHSQSSPHLYLSLTSCSIVAPLT